MAGFGTNIGPNSAETGQNWPKSIEHGPRFVAVWPTVAQRRPDFDEFGRRRLIMAHMCLKFGRCFPGRNWLRVCPSWPKLARHRPDFGRVWPSLTSIGPACAQLVRTWRDFRFWSKLVHIGLRLNFGRHRAELDGFRPQFGRFRAIFGRNRANSGQRWPECKRRRSVSAQVRSRSTRTRPKLGDIDRICPDHPTEWPDWRGPLY